MKTTVGNILRLIREGKVDRQIQETAVGVIRAADIASIHYPYVIKNIAEFVNRKVFFVRDAHGTDVVYPAAQTLFGSGEYAYGDCEDHAVVAGSLLGSIGLPVKVVVVSKTGELWDHVFLRAGYPPDNPVHWVSVDTTIFPPSGREIPYVDQKVYEAD